MNINLHISDSAYRALINGGERRMRGSIGMISPTEADFTAYNISKPEGRKYMKLPHGRVSLSPKQARLTLSFDVDEQSAFRMDQAMADEAQQGADFVFDNAIGI